MREFSVNPCASQKLHMEQAGFTFDPKTNQPAHDVQWIGHGISVLLPETLEVPSLSTAVTLAINEAGATARRNLQKDIRTLLAL